MKAVGQWSDIRYQPMTEADLPDVMDIEPRAYRFHWTEGTFRDCIRQGYQMPLMRCGETVLGYAVYSLAANEAQLLNITIEPDYSGRGLGTLLLQHIIADCRQREARSLFLEVRESNTAANRLYQSQGFKVIGLRRNYYPGNPTREDAVMMMLMLSPD